MCPVNPKTIPTDHSRKKSLPEIRCIEVYATLGVKKPAAVGRTPTPANTWGSEDEQVRSIPIPWESTAASAERLPGTRSVREMEEATLVKG